MRFEPQSLLLITGGSGGVASAVAARAESLGLAHALVSRTTARTPSATPQRLTVQADVSTAAGAVEAVAAVTAHFGRPPDLLCHAAGNVRLGSVERTSDDLWREVMSANLDSSFHTLRAWLLALGPHPGAAVLFSSVAARIGTPAHAAVAAAKGGIEALVRSTAADVSGRGIRINALSLGLTDTPLARGFLASERGRQSATAQYPLGRLGDAGETAAQVLWLLSGDSAWMTGQVLALDGGFSAVRPLVRT